MSVLLEILDRLDEILNANAPPGTKVFRERTSAQAREEVPSVNTLVRDDDVEPHARETDKHVVVLEVVFRARDDDRPSSAAEALHEAVHAAIVNDEQLLQLADSVRLLGGPYEYDDADATLLVKTARYRFTYTTDQDSL